MSSAHPTDVQLPPTRRPIDFRTMLRFEEPAPEVDMPAQIDAFWASGWGVILTNVITVVAIVVIALVIRWLLHFAIRRTVNRIVSGVKRKQDVEDTQALNASPLAAVRLVQRTRTLGSVLTNFVNITLFIVVVLAVVQVLVPDILGSFTLLSAAIGAGLGFGAQNIVKDALNGFFMVIEDQLGVGDIVDLGHATGIVEDVRIRVTSVRDVNGTLWFVRNGEINRVGNMSQGWARVIVDLAVPYEADVEEVEAALPEVWGLESISADAMVIRVVMKARTSSKDDVARELRMRLKRALDDLGLKLPSLSSVILTGFDGVTRVKGAKPPKTAPSPVVPATDRRGLRTKRAVDSITGAGSVPPTDAAPGASPEPPAGPQTPPKDAP